MNLEDIKMSSLAAVAQLLVALSASGHPNHVNPPIAQNISQQIVRQCVRFPNGMVSCRLIVINQRPFFQPPQRYVYQQPPQVYYQKPQQGTIARSVPLVGPGAIARSIHLAN